MLSALVLTGAPARADSLRLLVQNGYLPQIPVLVRVEILTPDGSKNRDVWDAQATLTVDQPGVALSTNRVTLRNGLGSTLVTFSGGGDFNLTATVNSLQATRSLTTMTNAPVTSVGGILPGTSTTWTGLVLITNDVTVPSGHTLIIESNTIVLVNGVSSGTTAPDLLVNGAIQSLGTESHPVTITCANPGMRWGQIRHDNAQTSLYRFTAITLAGRATGEGHTSTAPVIRPTNSKIVFESCTISDLADASGTPGKIMFSPGGQSVGSDIAFNDCLLARARTGPEVQETAVLCTNTWIMEMRGPDDADGIYLHDQKAGQQLRLSGCVIAGGDDDGIDTLDSNIQVENCIIRDWRKPNEDAKGISVFNGQTHVRHCLIVNCLIGVSAKWSGGPATLVTIDQSTITGITNAVTAAFKSNAPGPNIDFRITNSVMWATVAVHSDFGPTNLTIGYCNTSNPWPGTGNVSADPLFVDAAAFDYHLQTNSPCIDAGDPASALDPDGTRADLGFFPFFQTPGQAPAITAQPQSQIVMAGDSVTFGVTATGTQPLGYQWWSNNVSVAGVTGSTLAVAGVALANSGDAFRVVVTNAVGTVPSDTAILTVVGPPQLTQTRVQLDGTFGFTLASDGIRTYRIEGTTDFTNWEMLFTLVNTNGLAEWRDTNTASFDHRFYRVRSQP